MSEKKMTKKELRAPDAFQAAGGEAQAWLQARTRLVSTVVVLVLLGGSGVAVASYLSSRGEEKASRQLGEALTVVGRPVEGEASASSRSDDDLPLFKTAKEKDEATLKAMQEFLSTHPGARAPEQTARLTLGQAQLRLGQYDDALKTLDAYLQAAPAADPLRAAALAGRGYAYEGKHELEKAMDAFEQLARDNKTEFLAGMGQYHHARILLEQGKKQEAANLFAEVQTQFPGSAAHNLSGERLALLAAEGIQPPPKPVASPLPVAVTLDAGH